MASINDVEWLFELVDEICEAAARERADNSRSRSFLITDPKSEWSAARKRVELARLVTKSGGSKA